MLSYVLSSSVPPSCPFSPTLLCTHSPLRTLMLLPSHVQLYLHSLQSKSYTRNQRYPLPNSDCENDNSIFSASSGIPTTFLPVLLSHTMRLILRLDLTFLHKMIVIHLKLNYVPQIMYLSLFPQYFIPYYHAQFYVRTSPVRGCTIKTHGKRFEISVIFSMRLK